MYKKLISLTVIILMLGLAGSVYAANTYNDDGDDHLWNNPDNWSMDFVPEDETTYPGDLDPQWSSDVYMTIDGTLCVIDDTHVGANAATAYGTLVGAHGGDNDLHILGGELRCGSWGFNIGRGGKSSGDEGSFGHVYMTGGTVSTPWLQVPEQHIVDSPHTPITSGPNQNTWVQQGEFIMTDGAITTGWFHVGETVSRNLVDVNSIGRFDLHGGTVHSLGDFEMGPDGILDIEEGTLIIDSAGFSVEVVQQYIDNGWITAYGGSGCLMLDDGRRNPGQITLTASNTIALDYDLDGNGTIGFGDLAMFSDYWLKGTPSICGWEFNENETVDFFDFAELGAVWEGGP